MEVRRRPAAEARAPAARLNRRGVPGLPARRTVADAVDAAVHDDQGARFQPAPDGLRGDTDAEKLAAGHDSVPHTCQLGKDRLDRPALLVHSNT